MDRACSFLGMQRVACVECLHVFIVTVLTENVGSRKSPLEKVQRIDGCIQGPANGSDAHLERDGVCTRCVSVQKSFWELKGLG